MEKLHFSLADWDYDTPGPYISDAVYVSSPSSLAARKELAFDRQGWAMCKLDSAKNVFDGRIVNYFRLSRIADIQLFHIYRAQANPTAAAILPANCYHVSFRPAYCVIILRTTSTDLALASYNFVPPLSLGTWYQFRITWWQYLQPDMTKLLRHTLERYIAGAWVKILQVDDSINSWKDSATNKIGFLLLHKDEIGPLAIDNTEIWKRLT